MPTATLHNHSPRVLRIADAVEEYQSVITELRHEYRSSDAPLREKTLIVDAIDWCLKETTALIQLLS